MTIIDVYIERLILDGVWVPPGERATLQAAVETELVRLLLIGGVSEAIAAGGALPSIRTEGTIALAPDSGPSPIGTSIAQSLYGGIGGDEVTP